MDKQIILYVKDGEWVDGEVVGEESERKPSGNEFFNAFASFFNDNGREYNPATDNVEYAVDRQLGGTQQIIIPGYGDSMASDSGV